MPKRKKRIVIKVGSNVLAQNNGGLDVKSIEQLTRQIAALNKQGIEIILISSGAVAAGRSLINLPKKTDMISQRQLFAAVGQIKLINIYAEQFAQQGCLSAQVLVTKEDFRDREHYINMKNCITVLLQNNVLPILNENDVISVTELMFTDNDELAGLVSSMVDADKLIILSNVKGIYNGSPGKPSSEVIPVIEYGDTSFENFISSEKSNFGRGGMLTKCSIANKVASLGIPVQIANGRDENILTDILEGKTVGTLFTPKKNISSIKKWVAHSEGFVKGIVYIDEGAEKALRSNKPNSLLPVGVTKIEGSFKKGDIIKITGTSGKQLGVGRAEYNSEKATELMHKKNEKALVHYDYLFLNDHQLI
ncbi:MAG: gamma-glutamyl kinase [Ferruginibacter sp.]|nr:gamma-glutamyl kinase [Ferruginibacter sp.]